MEKRTQLSENLLALRRLHHMTQETLAARLGVSRQSVAKWEGGESIPDSSNCKALAGLYGIKQEDLMNPGAAKQEFPKKWDGRLLGAVTLGEKGQIVIPKRAREVYDLHAGEQLLVINSETHGITLVRASDAMRYVEQMKQQVQVQQEL